MNRTASVFSKLTFALLALVLVSGCNTAPKKDLAYAPARPVVPPPAPEGTGGIYQAGYDMRWFEDLRARRVGDILTVKLTERTNAQKSAKTSADKSSGIDIANPTLFGTTPEFDTPSILPLATNKNNNLAFSLSSDSSFEGEGDSSQSNNLTGDVTVTVVEVLPNGYLSIRGEKRIGINQGNEYIRLSGIVRPYDISTENTVASTKIADATIVYVGDGPVADSNIVGWLSRFFISALFPF